MPEKSESTKHAHELIQNLKRDPFGYVRKRAAEALGKIQDPNVVTALIDALAEPDPEVRKAVQGALQEIGTLAIEPLCKALGDERLEIQQGTVSVLSLVEQIPEGVLINAMKAKNTAERINAAEILCRRRDAMTVPSMVEALKDSEASVRMKAVEVIGRLMDESAVPALIEALSEEDRKIRARTMDLLGKMRYAEAVEPISKNLKDKDPLIREKAAKVLGEFDDKRGVSPLIDALKDNIPAVRIAAVDSLGRLKDESAVEAVTRLLNTDENAGVREKSAEVLEELKAGKSIEELIQNLKSGNPNIKAKAALAISRTRDKKAIGVLIESIKDPSEEVREKVIDALAGIEDEKVYRPLVQAWKDDSEAIRVKISAYLPAFGVKAMEALIEGLKDSDLIVRQNCAVALGKIKDQRAIEPLIAVLG
ncbi:MAG: HEAT repeat domain-containing protein, partial [Candidatus Omnitrophica bacterium]|nr:HEAT repeat domain-containing protein [Candidatus Omnitrophota bacterium]